MQNELEKHLTHLQQLKDYDETLAIEREDKARQEQERRRMEVCIYKENHNWGSSLIEVSICD